LSLSLCVVGLALAGYTLWVHMQPQSLVCLNADARFIHCEPILTSAQSAVVGIPTSTFGIAFFLALGAFCLPNAWRSPQAAIHILRFAVATVGLLSVLYLIFTELFTVKQFSWWCAGLQAATFALFVVVATSTPALLESTHPPKVAVVG
jgi:uncharacterized membrane protein